MLMGTKKLFISQPMRDKTDEEIKAVRSHAIKMAEKSFNDEYAIEEIDSFMQGAPHDANPLWFLGESLKKLSGADVAYFAAGYSDYRGCTIEYLAATLYGIPTIIEKEGEIPNAQIK